VVKKKRALKKLKTEEQVSQIGKQSSFKLKTDEQISKIAKKESFNGLMGSDGSSPLTRGKNM